MFNVQSGQGFQGISPAVTGITSDNNSIPLDRFTLRQGFATRYKFNNKFVNSTLKVLVLRNGKKEGQYLGRSPYNQSIYFNSEHRDLIGSTVDIDITESFQNSLTGIIKQNKSI